MIRRLIPWCLTPLFVAASSPLSSQPSSERGPTSRTDVVPVLAPDDRIRLQEAFRLSDAVGDSVWPGWRTAPLAVLLVTPDHEFLVRHPRPTSDFQRVGYDSTLASPVYVRPRVFSPGMLATFPAVAGVSTIVMGQPAATRQSSTRWVLTLLHEHFHQLQTSQPGYYDGVGALNLARGDTTGMWMLEYAFPYEAPEVASRFAAFTRAIAGVLATHDVAALPTAAQELRRARAELQAVISADDARYLGFQLWQEGIARYTEVRLAERAASLEAPPSAAFRALPDYTPYEAVAATLTRDIRAELEAPRLARQRRVAFYATGAALGLALDRLEPTWRSRYFAEPFRLGERETRRVP